MLHKRTHKGQKGVGLVEIIIVLLVVAIIVVLALPQIIASRRLLRFSGLQRQVAASLRDARQEAMSQRTPVTFRFDNATKKIVVYGGSLGALGSGNNRALAVATDGLLPQEVVYGRPPGATVAALGDSSNLTTLSGDAVEVQFQPDGSVIDTATGSPRNKAMFFYNTKTPAATAFAVSVLGAGGRAKIWRYSPNANAYVE